MTNISRLRWAEAISFAFRQKGWQKKLLLGGALIALLPPLGWLLALGYRKEFAFRLIDGEKELLPDWRRWKRFLVDGCKAAGVICAYFAPFVVLYWLFAVENLRQLAEHWLEVSAFVVSAPFFLPVLLPVLPTAYAYHFDWVSFSTPEVLVLAGVFLGTTFVMPAAFLQISLHRSFASALRVDRGVRLIAENLPAYVEAWVISLLVTALGLCSLVLAPWLLFWSYLVIGYAFNNALAASQHGQYSSVYARAGFQR